MRTLQSPSRSWVGQQVLLLPLTAYSLSYAYLAYYHGKPWLLTTIIHEGGKLDLLRTIFYAPHFIGHLPVVTVVALFFSGFWLLLVGRVQVVSSQRIGWSLLALLIVSFIISLTLFSARETQDFLLQRKQSESVYGEGGSWNLYLPSTMLLPLLIPAYVTASSRWFEGGGRSDLRGIRCLLLGAALTVAITLLVNDDSMLVVRQVWVSPRYLAHSVRELATFPVTYFPLALFFLVSCTRRGHREDLPSRADRLSSEVQWEAW